MFCKYVIITDTVRHSISCVKTSDTNADSAVCTQLYILLVFVC